MKHTELSSRWSSFLVSPVVMAVMLVGAVTAAFFSQTRIAAALMFVVLFALISRVWAFFSAKDVKAHLSVPTAGLFPGDDITLSVTLENNKFLPLIWLEVYMPVAKNRCLLPRESRKTEEWEASYLKDNGLFTEFVCERRLSSVLWYETDTVETVWHAEKRGIYSINSWQLRTGDGFGLTQIELPFTSANGQNIAVFPKLIEVSTELFTRNLWNSESGDRGVMEDNTLIRSTRDYMPTDSVKHINWRLAARGLPLAVNVYEDILPKSAHFIFDGSSYLHSETPEDDIEDSLSVLASLFVRLSQLSVGVGLTMPAAPGLYDSAGALTEELLYALAAYDIPETSRDAESGAVVYPSSGIDPAELIENIHRCGRFYYICYSTEHIDPGVLAVLDKSRVTVLTCAECEPFGEYETVCLQKFKGRCADV